MAGLDWLRGVFEKREPGENRFVLNLLKREKQVEHELMLTNSEVIALSRMVHQANALVSQEKELIFKEGKELKAIEAMFKDAIIMSKEASEEKEKMIAAGRKAEIALSGKNIPNASSLLYAITDTPRGELSAEQKAIHNQRQKLAKQINDGKLQGFLDRLIAYDDVAFQLEAQINHGTFVVEEETKGILAMINHLLASIEVLKEKNREIME